MHRKACSKKIGTYPSGAKKHSSSPPTEKKPTIYGFSRSRRVATSTIANDRLQPYGVLSAGEAPFRHFPAVASPGPESQRSPRVFGASCIESCSQQRWPSYRQRLQTLSDGLQNLRPSNRG